MYNNIIFDLDSTLTTIEGIDELARMKGVEQHVAAMTEQAMNGDIPFQEIFEKRLDIIKPTRADVVKLGELYQKSLTRGARNVIRELHRKNIQTFIISAGYIDAVFPVSRMLGIPDDHIFAIELLFDANGLYAGFNTQNPLWKNDGKKQVIRALRDRFAGSFAFIGDSASDLAAGKLTDLFVCFAGIIARPNVMKQAKIVVTEKSLTRILKYIL